MADSQRSTFLDIGIVARPHGIDGELKVQLAPEYIEALGRVKRVYLDGSPDAKRIQSFRVHQNAALLKLEGVDTRNDAEALRGMRVSIKVKELPRLGEGEYYTHDLIGLRVIDELGQDLGKLTEVLSTGSNDVYVIKPAVGKELLLPAIESVVRKIDLEAQVVSVIVPQGLRD
ncbi:MAG: ribosome maturation factor RimM [Chloroflexi bacterium]|nr:ribosome maturation factor RimM [Chloroflexota bacterium]